MKYYADKDGVYIGATNTGLAPDGSEFVTDKAPLSADLIFDAINDEWIDSLE